MEACIKLRDYQLAAVDGVFEKWNAGARAVIGVAATGSGKTQIASEIIRRNLPGRSLVLVHREELVRQAVNRLQQFGVDCEIEKAELIASTSLWNRTPAVVATIQTLISGKHGNKRMQRFNPKDFSCIWLDECHHVAAASWMKTLRYFLDGNPNLKIFGCTATPDRADNLALSVVFEDVAFDIEITDLIQRGYLVDIDQRVVEIQSLDLSGCRTTAGDLNGRDLAEVMEFEKTLLGIADATLKVCGKKRTIIFAASVKQAERMAEIFNRHKQGIADCVFGHTKPEKRSEIFNKFSSGELQILVNVGVATEGVDVPGVEAVVMARPTKSRALYAQCIGRGTRPLAGVVEGAADDDSARRAAIAGSTKPSLLVLDFKGNAGRHLLVSTADILGGKVCEEARKLARSRVEKKGEGKMLDELLLAEMELKEKNEAALRSRIVGSATFTTTYIDPFDAFKKRQEKWQGFQQFRKLSEKQRHLLMKHGHDPDARDFDANIAIFKTIIGISDKQKAVLIRAGYSPDELAGMTKWDGGKMITELAKNNWRRPQKEVTA